MSTTVDISPLAIAKDLQAIGYKVGSRTYMHGLSLHSLFTDVTTSNDVAILYASSNKFADVQALLQGYYLYLLARENKDFMRVAIGSSVFPIKASKRSVYDIYDVMEYLDKATSTEQYRPALNFIYKDVDASIGRNHYVATDGFRMYITEDTMPFSESRVTGYYQFIGDTLTDKVLDEKFPPYANVIPELSDCTLKDRLDIDSLYTLQGRVKCYLDICKAIAKYGDIQGLISYFDEITDNRTEPTEATIDTNWLSIGSICFNAKYLHCAIGYLIRYVGAHSLQSIDWHVSTNNPTIRASTFRGTDTLPAVLLMPVKATNATVTDIATGSFTTME